MARLEPVRRLIVNADDFGRSHSINAAVVRAHREGILTTASLMVNGAAANEAVALAGQNPRLGVGLHLSLIQDVPVLNPADIPGLVDARGRFGSSPMATGLRYFFRKALRPQLEREIHAQFDRFHATGLPLDHVNGHLHFHLHPIVFNILMQHARHRGVTRFRLTRDPLRLNLGLAPGRPLYRASHALIFQCLAGWARPELRRLGIKHTAAVFGLLQDGRVDEDFIARLISRLPAGDSELYSHPSLGEFGSEFDALVSPRILSLVREHDLRLIRYQDL